MHYDWSQRFFHQNVWKRGQISDFYKFLTMIIIKYRYWFEKCWYLVQIQQSLWPKKRERHREKSNFKLKNIRVIKWWRRFIIVNLRSDSFFIWRSCGTPGHLINEDVWTMSLFEFGFHLNLKKYFFWYQITITQNQRVPIIYRV